MIMAATASQSVSALDKILDERVATPLARVTGVGTVSVAGAPKREIQVYCDPAKLEAYSLSIPFVSTFVFAAVMKHQDAPGTTFKRHMRIAKGVLNEDDYLLQEILFNPYTHDQVSQIRTELKELLEIIDTKNADGMKAYLTKIRNNVKRDIEIKR